MLYLQNMAKKYFLVQLTQLRVQFSEAAQIKSVFVRFFKVVFLQFQQNTNICYVIRKFANKYASWMLWMAHFQNFCLEEQ